MEPEVKVIDYVKSGDVANLATALDNNPLAVHQKHVSGKSLLLLATYYQQQEVIQELLKRGAQPDIYDVTAMGDREQLEKMLCQRPSAVFTRHQDGTSLLGLAVYFGHTAIVQLLLDHKADPNTASSSHLKVYPIHSAVAQKNEILGRDLIKVLLKAGAHPNLTQDQDRTALHLAARQNKPLIAKVLLNHGGDIWLEDNKGHTAESIAKTLELQEMCALFEENRRERETEAFIDTELLQAMRNGEFDGLLSEI